MAVLSLDRIVILTSVVLALVLLTKLPAVQSPANLLIATNSEAAYDCGHEQRAADLPAGFDLRKCYKEEFEDVPGTVRDYETDQPSRFKVEASMYSARPRVGGLTITTGGAPNRLAMLDDLCATWVGPLIVAVWVPVIAPGARSERNATDLAAVEADIRALFDRAEASTTGCQMDVMLLTELMVDDLMMATYPINAVRNMATLLARTELVLPLDADFLVSSDLNDIVLDPQRYAELLELAKAQHVIVPPAYRIDEDEALARTVAAGGREAALQALANGTMNLFDGGGGQSPTQYPRWLNETGSYEVPFISGFEPWGIVYRVQCPWFDNRFRGRALDKVNWFRVLNFTEFRFTVHHDAFIVHRPHPYAGAFNKQLRQMWSRNTATHHEINQQLRNGTYATPVTPAFRRCQEQLPWWNHYGPGGEPAKYRTLPVPFQPSDAASPAA